MRRYPKPKQVHTTLSRRHVHSRVNPIGNIPIPNPFEVLAKKTDTLNGTVSSFWQQLSSIIYFLRGLTRMMTFFAASLVFFCAATNFENLDKSLEVPLNATSARKIELRTTIAISVFQRGIELAAVVALMFETIVQTKTPFGKPIGPVYSWLNIFRLPYYFVLAMLYFQAAAIDLGDGTRALIDLGLDDNFDKFKPVNTAEPPSFTNDLGVGRLMYSARIVLVTFGAICLAVEMVHISLFIPGLSELTRFVTEWFFDHDELEQLGSDVFYKPYGQILANKDRWAWTIKRYYEDIKPGKSYNPNAILRIIVLGIWWGMAMTGLGYEGYYLNHGRKNFKFSTAAAIDFLDPAVPPTAEDLSAADVGAYSLGDFILTSMCTMGIVLPVAMKFTFYFGTAVLSRVPFLNKWFKPVHHRINSIEGIAAMWSLGHAVVKAEAFFKAQGVFQKKALYDVKGLEGTAAQTNVCILTWVFFGALILAYVIDVLAAMFPNAVFSALTENKEGACMGGSAAYLNELLDLVEFGILNATSWLSPIFSAVVAGGVMYLLFFFGAFKGEEDWARALIVVGIGLGVWGFMLFFGRRWLKNYVGGAIDAKFNAFTAVLEFKLWRFLYPLAVFMGCYSFIYFTMGFGADIIVMKFGVGGKLVDISGAVSFIVGMADGVIGMVGVLDGLLNPCMNKVTIPNGVTATGDDGTTPYGDTRVGYDPWHQAMVDLLRDDTKFKYCMASDSNVNYQPDTETLWTPEEKRHAAGCDAACMDDFGDCDYDEDGGILSGTCKVKTKCATHAKGKNNPDGIYANTNYCWSQVAAAVKCKGDDQCTESGYGTDHSTDDGIKNSGSECHTTGYCTAPQLIWRSGTLENSFPPTESYAAGGTYPLKMMKEDSSGGFNAETYQYTLAVADFTKATKVNDGNKPCETTLSATQPPCQTCHVAYYNWDNARMSNLIAARSRLKSARATDPDGKVCFDNNVAGKEITCASTGDYAGHLRDGKDYVGDADKDLGKKKTTFNLKDYGGAAEVDAESLVTYDDDCLQTVCIATGAVLWTTLAISIGGNAVCTALDVIPYFPGGLCSTIVSLIGRALTMAAKAAAKIFDYGKRIGRSIAGLFRKRKAINSVKTAVQKMTGQKSTPLQMPPSMMINFSPVLMLTLFSFFMGFWRREATTNFKMSFSFAMAFLGLLATISVIFAVFFGVGGMFVEMSLGVGGANITSTAIAEQTRKGCGDEEKYFGYNEGIFLCSLQAILDVFMEIGEDDDDGSNLFTSSVGWGPGALYLRRALFMQMLTCGIFVVFFLLDAAEEGLKALPYVGWLFRENYDLLPKNISGPMMAKEVNEEETADGADGADGAAETDEVNSEFAPLIGADAGEAVQGAAYGVRPQLAGALAGALAVAPALIGAKFPRGEQRGTTTGGWLVAWIFIVPVMTNAIWCYGNQSGATNWDTYVTVEEPQRLYKFVSQNSDRANEALGELAESGIFGAHNNNVGQVFGTAACDISPTGLIFKGLLTPLLNNIDLPDIPNIDALKLPNNLPNMKMGSLKMKIRSFSGIKKLWGDLFDMLGDLSEDFGALMGDLNLGSKFDGIDMLDCTPNEKGKVACVKYGKWEFWIVWTLPLVFCTLVILGTVLSLLLPDDRQKDDWLGRFKIGSLNFIRACLFPLAFTSLQQIVAIMGLFLMMSGLDAVLFRFEVGYGPGAGAVYQSALLCIAAAAALNFNEILPING